MACCGRALYLNPEIVLTYRALKLVEPAKGDLNFDAALPILRGPRRGSLEGRLGAAARSSSA
jgi:hypothetical protein